MIGTKLGSYEVLARLGEGGMGEVYRARDPKLHRDVAIKVLPPAFAADPERLARFEREAQILASLNHGGIAHVYGVTEDPPALVMELVDGRTLDVLIPQGGMALGDALGLAIQMADALAAAHAAGVVHRDFKPGNVAVTPAGAVKVLDFGLAKTFADETPGAMTLTAAAPRTAPGVVMGTVAYMSPEQAAGRQVDPRSDIFSFGSVLFEMVTGRRPFDRDTSMSTLAAIINEPARTVTQVNAAVPRDLERLIARCHRKDPARRVQSMADLRSALEELRDDLEAGRLSGSTSVPIARQRSRAIRYAAAALTGLALLAVGAAIGRVWLAPAPQAPVRYRLEAMTADPGVTADPAVTSRGDLLAYASDRHDGTNLDIWVQPTAGGEPVRVTADPADDSAPAFSPDGSRIAFRSEREGGGIYVVPALGGTERLLVPLGRAPRYSPDGKWLLFSTGGRGSVQDLYLMPAGGGEPQQVAPDVIVVDLPAWAPDSGAILIAARPRQPGGAVQPDILIVRVDDRGIVSEAPRNTGAAAVIRDAGLALTDIVSWNGREVIFSASIGEGGALWVVSTEGGPRVPRQVYSTTERLGGATVAANGRIFFAASKRSASIASMPIDGTRAVSGPPQELTRTVAIDRWPSLSADGATLAFESTRYGASMWVRDLASGRETQLPAVPGAASPVISPDGKRVAYGLRNSIFVVETRGGMPRTVCEGCGYYVSSWTSDGAYVIANTVNTKTQRPRPVAIHVATGKITPVTEKSPVWFGRVSPDRRWIAFFEWPEPDRTREIVVRYTPGQPADDAAWIPVTEGQSVDEGAAWSADGRTLYFTSERDGFRCLYASRFDPGAGRVLGPPEPVLHLHGTRRSLINTAGQPARIDVAGGRLVFSMQEVAANIWSLTPQ